MKMEDVKYGMVALNYIELIIDELLKECGVNDPTLKVIYEFQRDIENYDARYNFKQNIIRVNVLGMSNARASRDYIKRVLYHEIRHKLQRDYLISKLFGFNSMGIYLSSCKLIRDKIEDDAEIFADHMMSDKKPIPIEDVFTDDVMREFANCINEHKY